MNLRFSSPSGAFAFIQIITEDGYIVYRYASEDDHNRSMQWLETYEIDGTPDDDDVLAVLPAGKHVVVVWCAVDDDVLAVLPAGFAAD